MMKRLFDIVVSSVMLICFLPLFLIIACLVWRYMGRPVLFEQLRPGLQSTPYRMVKFRTMKDICSKDGQLLPDEQRLTPFGNWLRRSSLDELPELLNVLKGDMSLVGPRPLLMEYLPLYSPEQARRHLVKPGITGLAQVNGRNSISWKKKYELDVWYVDNRTFKLDLEILYKTLIGVFRQDGVMTKDNKIMPKFEGNSDER